MFKKFRKNEKGFTLAELLIVVAIIGVLVAISIPIFTAQLEKSRDAVTVANLRSAYAEASALMLTEPDSKSATSGTAKKTDANVVEVSNVDLPCTDKKADLTSLPFGDKVTLQDPSKNAKVTFTFGTDGSITAVTIGA